MNTNDIKIIREALDEMVLMADVHKWPQVRMRANSALAHLDRLEAQHPAEPVEMAASLSISEGLQARIDRVNRLLEARSSQAQQPRVRYRSQVSGMWYETLEAAGDVDCVEVDGVQFCQENGVKCLTQQQPKRLTDEHYRIIANRMLEEHGKYGDKLRAGHWAEIAARKVVSHLQDFGYIGGLSVEESDSIQRMLDMVDELMKLKDIHRKKLIGTATKEEWAYYQLQCEAIYPGVKDAADQMRARLTAKLNGTLS